MLLHPGTTKVDDDRFPFACPNTHPTSNERLPEEIADILDRLLLKTSEPQRQCTFALYAGYLNEEDRGASQGFHEPDATRHVGRLNYMLFAGTLAESTFGGVADHWGVDFSFFQSLSHLWPDDHSWFLASTQTPT